MVPIKLHIFAATINDKWDLSLNRDGQSGRGVINVLTFLLTRLYPGIKIEAKPDPGFQVLLLIIPMRIDEYKTLHRP
jgi:hypothetical protein